MHRQCLVRLAAMKLGADLVLELAEYTQRLQRRGSVLMVRLSILPCHMAKTSPILWPASIKPPGRHRPPQTGLYQRTQRAPCTSEHAAALRLGRAYE